MSMMKAESTHQESLDPFPRELAALKEKIQDQPPAVREALEPLMDEVIEHAVFRSRVMLLARDALQQYRVEQAALKFNLEVSRRERTTWTK